MSSAVETTHITAIPCSESEFSNGFTTLIVLSRELSIHRSPLAVALAIAEVEPRFQVALLAPAMLEIHHQDLLKQSLLH